MKTVPQKMHNNHDKNEEHDRRQIEASLRVLRESQATPKPPPLEVYGLTITVWPKVFSPRHFNGWRIFTEHFPDVTGEDVLEIGSGTGITALHLAKNRDARSVLAVDITPQAIENTKENSVINHVANIEVRYSDIFSGLMTHERFHTIYWNLPFIYMPDDYQYTDALERGLFDPGYKYTERFIAEATMFLHEGGRLLVGLADFADLDRFNELAKHYGYNITCVASEQSTEVHPVEFQLYELRPKPRLFYAMQFTGRKHAEIVTYRKYLHALADKHDLYILEQFIDVEEEELFHEHGYLPLYIARKDHDLLAQANIVLIDYHGHSIGRDCELVVANEVMDKRVIAIVQDEQMQNHPYIRLYSSYLVTTTEEAFELAGRLSKLPLSSAISKLSRRQKDSTDLLISQQIQQDGLQSVADLMPTEMLQRWRQLLGEEYEELLKRSFIPPPKTIRLHPHKITKAEFADCCRRNSWRQKSVNGLEGVYRLELDKNAIPFSQVPEYNTGCFYVQDLASQLAPIVLAPQAGERVLELGAAPGSKSTQMALMMKNSGHILAMDISGERLAVLHTLADRQQITIIETQQADATRLDSSHIERYDRVLVDAPCSCEGIIRYKAHKFLEWSLLQMYRLIKTQEQMLENGFAALKPGGSLVYATCTYAPEENEAVVDALLQRHQDAELATVALPDDIVARPGMTAWRHHTYDQRLHRTRRIYPMDNDSIGFYLAKITKNR